MIYLIIIYLVSIIIASKFIRRFNFEQFIQDVLGEIKRKNEVLNIIGILHFIPVINTILSYIFLRMLIKRLWQKRK